MSKFIHSSVLAIALAVFPNAAAAQQLTGSILGTVIDPSQSVVAGASVKVRNTATQVARTTLTTSDGAYDIASLLPGVYELTVNAAGFQTTVIGDVQVAFGARRRVDVAMTVGDVATRVTVSAEASIIETDSPRINQSMPEKKVLDMPYNQLSTLNLGRYFPPIPSSGWRTSR